MGLTDLFLSAFPVAASQGRESKTLTRENNLHSGAALSGKDLPLSLHFLIFFFFFFNSGAKASPRCPLCPTLTCNILFPLFSQGFRKEEGELSESSGGGKGTWRPSQREGESHVMFAEQTEITTN